MQVKPNQTVLEGQVIDVQPAANGSGTQVKLDVRKNLSVSPEDDFLRSAPGDIVELTAPDTPEVQVGDTVRAAAKLLAGPRGGRAILQSIQRI